MQESLPTPLSKMRDARLKSRIAPLITYYLTLDYLFLWPPQTPPEGGAYH